MMTFAMDVVRDNVEARLSAGFDETLPPKGIVRALLIQLLPLDEARLLDGHVALAFYAYSAVRPAVTADLRENTTQMRTFIASKIQEAQATSGAAPRLNPLHAATALSALVEGLAIQVVCGHYPPEEALAALETQLDTVFGAP
jgi:hypothetical protein